MQVVVVEAIQLQAVQVAPAVADAVEMYTKVYLVP
jgi:hypothetical protein